MKEAEDMPRPAMLVSVLILLYLFLDVLPQRPAPSELTGGSGKSGEPKLSTRSM